MPRSAPLAPPPHGRTAVGDGRLGRSRGDDSGHGLVDVRGRGGLHQASTSASASGSGSASTFFSSIANTGSSVGSFLPPHRPCVMSGEQALEGEARGEEGTRYVSASRY